MGFSSKVTAWKGLDEASLAAGAVSVDDFGLVLAHCSSMRPRFHAGDGIGET
jgi:hypothetical protein